MVHRFQVKMLEDGGRNIFRDKETANKEPLIFQILNCLPKGNNCIFGLIEKRSKVWTLYLAFENLKISSKKVNSGQKAKSKARTILIEVKMQEQSCR